MSITFAPNTYPSTRAFAPEEDSLNVSNTHAVLILGALGLDASDPCGEADANTLMALCALYCATSMQDLGVPSEQHGNVITCGRREGYLDERIAELGRIAAVAADAGVEVYWG
jgi:hypothetical protein